MSESSGPPGLVEGWVRAWTLSRGVNDPVRRAAGWFIDVNRPGHVSRLVAPQWNAIVAEYARTVSTDGTWLKVCSPFDSAELFLQPHWLRAPTEYLMSTPLAPGAARAERPHAYSVSQARVRPGVTEIRLVGPEGDLAARGVLAVVDDFAMFDQIITEPEHRRRGLATAVVDGLVDIGVASGAATGILVATEQGRALYEKLGWRVVSPVTVGLWTSESSVPDAGPLAS